MTWRAWSARLIVSSDPVFGARCSVIAWATSRRRRPDAVDARQVARPLRVLGGRLGADAVRALGVDDASVDEPGERGVERRELFDRETILGVVGVQEVEGVLEIDVVGVAAIGRDLVRGCSWQ